MLRTKIDYNFRWKTKGLERINTKHQGGMPSMEQRRYRASAVLNQEGDIWVFGGVSANTSSRSTEVYKYRPNGKGEWRKGEPLPETFRDTGIESHCTIRYFNKLNKITILIAIRD